MGLAVEDEAVKVEVASACRKPQGRLKEDSRKTQGRLKEDSRKTQGRLNEDSRKIQGRLKIVVVVLFALFVCLFVCQNHTLEGSDLFKQALEGGSSLILLSSLFGRRDPLLNHCILLANY